MSPLIAPQPTLLPVNQIDHFYLGGDRIGALRHGPGGPRRPEEWLGSTTTRFGEAVRGITQLDGGDLRSLVASDPEAWLGRKHVERYGANPALLTKLLDAGERLPVHVHPTKRFAKNHLDCDFGKTEAWVILETPKSGASVWVGCKENVTDRDLRARVDAQDKTGLVAMLNELTVFPGDAVLVPSGTPHCTGAGAFVLELQEPTDLSVLLEWEGFALDGENDGHLNLGFDRALQCVNRSAFTSQQLTSLIQRNGMGLTPGTNNMMPSTCDPYFRTVRVHRDAVVSASFAIVLVTDGEGRCGSKDLRKGDVLLVPHCAGDLRFSGNLTALVALPPHPAATPPTEFDM